MKLADLEARFRHVTGDKVIPYLFKSADVHRWLNEAEDEACKRGDLLYEDREATMCDLSVAEGGYPRDLDPRWTRIDTAVWRVAGEDDADGLNTNLRILVDRKVLDQESSTWRFDSNGDPATLLIERRRLRLVPAPCEAGTLHLEGYRLPLEPMQDGKDEPEIEEKHHLHLVDWALKLAFERPDSETRDPGRAQAASEAFDAYFGPPRDSMLYQETEDAPKFNRVFFP